MKAVVYYEYGPPEVLKITELPKPTPKPGQVLVQVRATAITSGDWRARSLDIPPGFKFISRLMFGYSKPRNPILGADFAGTVEAVGEGVTEFKRGDEVFGVSDNFGAYAEYLVVKEKGSILPKPSNLSFEEAASIPFGAITSQHYLMNMGKLKKGESLLIYGASGAVGTAGIQLAKHLGCSVTAVCSGGNADFVKSLGADQVIDYKKDDVRKSGLKWDVVYDTLGKISYPDGKKLLTEKGRMLQVVANLGELVISNLTSGGKFKAGVALGNKSELRRLKELIDAGKYKAVIDRTYRLEDIVEAHRYLDSGRKRGNVVIRVSGGVNE